MKENKGYQLLTMGIDRHIDFLKNDNGSKGFILVGNLVPSEEPFSLLQGALHWGKYDRLLYVSKIPDRWLSVSPVYVVEISPVKSYI